ncbi:MAG TPA: redoxin family protein [Chryseolinea sp.]|nr:redoxin family protein [Chryseolinea sp.]
MWCRSTSIIIICCVFWTDLSAQDFSLDAISTVKISFLEGSDRVPVLVRTFHPFPAFDYYEISDSLYVDRNIIFVNCPVRTLQEGDISFGASNIHVLLIPGDTIEINLHGPSNDPTVVFAGKSMHIQNYYLKKTENFPISTLQQMMNAASNAANLVDFKLKADKLYQEQEIFWKSALVGAPTTTAGRSYQNKQLLPEWFMRYESDAMKYQNAMLRVYAVIYQEFMLHKKNVIPEGYFDFLKSLPLSNETAMYDYAYQQFLLHYFPYKAERGPDSNHDKEFQLATEVLSGKVADFYKLSSISTALIHSPNEVSSELDKTQFGASSQYLVDYLRKRASTKIKSLGPGDNAPNFYLEDKIDSLVSLSQFKGEVVYLSFWFAGCKPCIEEFPYENDLVKKFESKPVKVISICTRTSKTKWLQMIDTHKLKTVNLFANKGWEGMLEKNYLIGIYPHYVLVGKDGRVIENFAKRPREISGEIQSALDR